MAEFRIEAQFRENEEFLGGRRFDSRLDPGVGRLTSRSRGPAKSGTSAARHIKGQRVVAKVSSPRLRHLLGSTMRRSSSKKLKMKVTWSCFRLPESARATGARAACLGQG
jgi:hypothetical protein